MDDLLNPFSPQALADPYPVYRRLRAQAPVLAVAPGRWVVTRHADVCALLTDPRCTHWGQDRASDTRRSPHEQALADALRLLAPSTPPGAVRRSLGTAFNTTVLDSLPGILAPRAHALLETLCDGQVHDVLREYAHPLTLQAVGIMLGLRADQILALDTAMASLDGLLFECLVPAGGARAATGPAAAMQRCLDRLIEDAAQQPASLLHQWRLSEEGPDADAHDAGRLLNVLLVVIHAAHHNMQHFIGNALLSLALQPQARAQLRRTPALLDKAVLELMRHDSPLQYIVLSAREALPLHGQSIARGDEILACIGSANRDEAVFRDPDRLDFARPNPMDSLSFGLGAWRCMGARMALRMGVMALNAFLRCDTELAAPVHALHRARAPMVQRGLLALPMTLQRERIPHV